MSFKALAASLAVCVMALPRLALAWDPDGATVQKLRSGDAWAEVLPDTQGAALIHSVVDIQAPPRVVWNVLTDCHLAMKMIGNLERCVVLKGDMRQGWDIREQDTKGNFILPEIHNVVHSDYTPYSLVHFRLAGGDLKIEEGDWRLVSLGGGTWTRVIYINRVKTNIMAPEFLVRAGLKASMPKVLMNLKRESLAAVRRG